MPKSATEQINPKNYYDAALILCPAAPCNLNCVYCSAAKERRNSELNPQIDADKFIQVLNATNKTFNIIFSGSGEPFMIPNIVDICRKIAKGHYLSFVTNLTNTSIREFANSIDPKRVVFILASAHINELKERNLLDTYFDNFSLLKNKGFTMAATEVAYPFSIREARKQRNFFAAKGIDLRFKTFVGSYAGKEYPAAYKIREALGFKINIRHHNQYNKFCNAGYNIAMVSPNGDVRGCPLDKDKLGNIYEKIEFKDKVTVCANHFCPHPLNECDLYLFDKYLKEAIPSIYRFLFYIRFYPGLFMKKIKLFIKNDCSKFINNLTGGAR